MPSQKIEELDPEFFAKTTPDMGWLSLSNGELLSVGEVEFDVFITSNKNLSFQQSITSSSIQVILLKARTNTYEDLLPLVEKLHSVINAHEPGKFLEIE